MAQPVSNQSSIPSDFRPYTCQATITIIASLVIGALGFCLQHYGIVNTTYFYVISGGASALFIIGVALACTKRQTTSTQKASLRGPQLTAVAGTLRKQAPTAAPLSKAEARVTFAKQEKTPPGQLLGAEEVSQATAHAKQEETSSQQTLPAEAGLTFAKQAETPSQGQQEVSAALSADSSLKTQTHSQQALSVGAGQGVAFAKADETPSQEKMPLQGVQAQGKAESPLPTLSDYIQLVDDRRFNDAKAMVAPLSEAQKWAMLKQSWRGFNGAGNILLTSRHGPMGHPGQLIAFLDLMSNQLLLSADGKDLQHAIIAFFANIHTKGRWQIVDALSSKGFEYQKLRDHSGNPFCIVW